jgi:hypothetical protein
MDVEFMESVLVPQVMLYGFLGMEPRPGGFRLDPKLPQAWPELTVTRIQAQAHVLDITAKRNEITLLPRQTDGSSLCLWLPPGRWKISNPDTNSKADAVLVVIRGEGDCAKVKLVSGKMVRLQRAGP